MRRRILFAIVGVTVVATVVLTVPLVIVIARRESADAVRELERIAQRTGAGLTVSPGANGDTVELPQVERNVDVAVYRPDGTLIAGQGPALADEVTARARHLVVDGTVGPERVLADPVVINEQQAAIIRVAEPMSETTDSVRRDVLLLVLFDLGSVAVAALVGWVVAARLARPVRVMRDDAVRLGNGDFSIDPQESGIVEIDETASALAETASRLEAAMARERAFSADASHQLRTPLAALRLSVETELLDPRPDPRPVLEEALVQVDRLEDTVTTLLAVARDRPPQRDRLDVDRFLRDLRHRWAGRLGTDHRSLHCAAIGPVSVHVSLAVLDQIMDILLGNSVDHGEGTVTVTAQEAPGGLHVTVEDEGHLLTDTDHLFTRRHPDAAGHGVGLSLARGLAEAESGRLVLVKESPTMFRLVLPDAAPAAD